MRCRRGGNGWLCQGIVNRWRCEREGVAMNRWMRRTGVPSRVSGAVALLAALCVAVSGAALVAIPAHAQEVVPNLTVHVTSGTVGTGSANNDGLEVILPQDQRPESAGSGFIYRLTQLDDEVVEAVGADTDEERTAKVLADLAEEDKRDAYLKTDDTGNTTTVFGITDEVGEITATGTTDAGSWVAGATVDDGQLVAAEGAELTPYQFNGDSAFPTEWLLELVYHPAGLDVQASAPGLIELPFVDDDLNINYDVHVYPKTQACTGSDMPGGPVVAASSYRTSGSGVANAGFEPCETAVPLVPTPPEEPTVIDRINQIARTGSNIAWIAMSALALALLALVLLAARRRSQRNREDADAVQATVTTQSATQSWGRNKR